MRLWSIHPKYLDRQGLLAVWRESLLAQKVLQEQTKGYRNHPQLQRFKEQKDPLAAIGAHLLGIYEESLKRDYAFDRKKIASHKKCPKIEVSSGQLEYEFRHLLKKLKARSPEKYKELSGIKRPQCHQLFIVRPGSVAAFERIGKP
jgi:hypothetical protein